MPFTPDQVRVVLVAPRNPLNIGAAARAMSNFGFLRLRVVNAYDVAYQEARSAVNAAPVLAASQQFATLAEAVQDCALVVGTASLGHRELQHSLKRLEQGARLIRDHAGPAALVFGSEKYGLSNEDMSHCHWLMRIPSRPEHESMNLGQAVAVCLYELIRDPEQAAAPSPARAHPATAEQTELLTGLLHEVLRESGYIKERTAESSEQKIRRLVRRLHLGHRDAMMWLGMLRQILWKVRN